MANGEQDNQGASIAPAVIPARAGIHATPAGMQVVEPRLEQAVEEGGPGYQADYTGDARRDNPCVVIPAWREWIV